MYSLSENWKSEGHTLEGFAKLIRGLSQITFAERIPSVAELDLVWTGDPGKNHRAYVQGKEYLIRRSNAESYLEIQDEVTDAVMYEKELYFCTRPAITDIGRLAGIGGTRFCQPCPERTRYLSVKLCDMQVKDTSATLVYRKKGATKLLLGIRGKSFTLHNMQAAVQAATYLCEKEGFRAERWEATNVDGVTFIAVKDRMYVRITDTMSGNASFTAEAGLRFAPGVYAPLSAHTVEHRGIREDAPITAVTLSLKEARPLAEKALSLENKGISSMEEQKHLLDAIWKAEGADSRRDGVVGSFKKSHDEEIKSIVPPAENRLMLLEAVYSLPAVLDASMMNSSEGMPQTIKSVEALLGA